MSMYTSLLDLAVDLAADPATKADFARDPEGFLADRGLDELGTDDLATALEHVTDSLPPDLAAQLPPASVADDPTEVLDRLARIEPEADDLDFGAGGGEISSADELDPEAEDGEIHELAGADPQEATEGDDGAAGPEAGDGGLEPDEDLDDDAADDPDGDDGEDAADGPELDEPGG